MNKLTSRLIGAMLLGVVVYGVIALTSDYRKIAETLGGYAWWTFGAACSLAFTNYCLRFLKWEYYLAVLGIRGVPKGESFLTFLAGFVLTITPGKVGEVFKSLVLFRLRDVPIARTAPIVVAERVTDLIGVIAMIAVGSTSFPGGGVWAAAGAGVVALLLLFVSVPRLSRALVAPLPRLPGGLGRVGARIAPKVEIALGELRGLTTPGRLVLPTLLSVAAWSLEGLALWVILRGFGEKAPLPLTGFFYATATLAGALVPLPGGLGVTETLLREQMTRIGAVSVPVATSAMMLVRFATLWFAVAVGFVALGILRAKNPRLAAEEPLVAASAEKTP